MAYIDPADLAARRAEVARLTRAGKSAAEIAVALGVTQRTITRDRKAVGVALPRHPGIPADTIAEIGRLLDDGASVTEAAKTVGCSEPSVRRYYPGRAWTRSQVAAWGAWVRSHQMDGAT